MFIFYPGDGQTFSFSDMGLPGARCQPSDEPITMTLGSKRVWMDLRKATASIEVYTCRPVNLSPIPFFFCQTCYLKGVKMLIRCLRWGARLSTTLSTTSLTQPPARTYVVIRSGTVYPGSWTPPPHYSNLALRRSLTFTSLSHIQNEGACVPIKAATCRRRADATAQVVRLCFVCGGGRRRCK